MSEVSTDIAAFDAQTAGMAGMIARYARERPARVASSLALALALAAFAAVPPIIIAKLVDGALQVVISIQTIVLYALALVVLAIGEGLLALCRRRLTLGGELEVREQAAIERFRASVRLPLCAFRGGNEAALIRSFDDIDSIVEFIAVRSIDLFAELAIVIVYAALMLSAEPWLALVFFALAVLATAHSVATARAIQGAAEIWLPARDSRFGIVVECLTSALTIKTLNAHRQVETPFRSEQQIEQEALRIYRDRQSVADAVSRFWSVVIPGLGAAFGAVMLMNGRLSAGSLVLFLSVSSGLVGALTGVHRSLLQLHEARASLARMRTITDAAAELLDDMGLAPVDQPAGIMARDIEFSHAGATFPTLHDLSLQLAPGDHIAIIGQSGAGKTTLAHLMARLLNPSRGSISLDETKLSPLALYRHDVVLAPHSVAVFGTNLRENVRLWDTTVPDTAVLAALEQASLATLVNDSEEGLETLLGARGNPLSAGQQQRLGLARVLLQRPKILILDEATSALDMETERTVLANLRAFMRGKVMIAITHREAVAATFDRVFRMQDGRLFDLSSS